MTLRDGVPAETSGRVHEDRLQQFVREGHASDADQLGRYSEHRRRAILVATVLDLESRPTDAVLNMTDKLIGGLFAKACNTARRRYAASASDVGCLMRLFHGTIETLAAAQDADADAFETVDDAVGWPKLLRVREEVQELANLAGEDSLVRAAAARGQEAQQFRASGLNLVIAAIVYWNSTYLADAVQHLRDQGKSVPDTLLTHTSPLTWEHIGFSGDFLWDHAAATAGHRRSLKLGRDRVAA